MFLRIFLYQSFLDIFRKIAWFRNAWYNISQVKY